VFLPILSFVPRVSVRVEPVMGTSKAPFLDLGDGRSAMNLTVVTLWPTALKFRGLLGRTLNL